MKWEDGSKYLLVLMDTLLVGNWYFGEIKNDVPNGRGRGMWQFTNYYDGEYVNSKQKGKCIWLSDNWQMFEGDTDMEQGNEAGILTMPDGKKLFVEFINHELKQKKFIN